MLKKLYNIWLTIPSKGKHLVHIVMSTLLIYFFLQIGSLLQLNIKAINPLTRSLTDYEITDVVFAKFKDKSNIDFDKDIVLINTGKPDREEIINTLEKLNKFETKAVGVDILFSELKDESTDSRLRKALMDNHNLVAAQVLGDYDNTRELFLSTRACAPYFCDSIQTGYINFLAKPESNIRLFSTHEMTEDGQASAFALKIVEQAKPELSSKLLSKSKSIERINYKGNSQSFVQYDIKQFLQEDERLENVFKDKIVLIGYLGDDQWSQSTRDKFYTPLNDKVAVKSLPDMYGVIIHANIISMILNENYIKEMPSWFNKLFAFFIIMLSVSIIRMDFISYKNVYWIFIKLLQVLVFLVLFYLVAGIFYFFETRLNITTGIFGVFIAWDIIDFYENIVRPKIKSIFLSKIDYPQGPFPNQTSQYE